VFSECSGKSRPSVDLGEFEIGRDVDYPIVCILPLQCLAHLIAILIGMVDDDVNTGLAQHEEPAEDLFPGICLMLFHAPA
jgi:hypothetical protein